MTSSRIESKGIYVELPPHKFGPHDLVELRANKGGASTPPVVSGVVYRCKERELTVAVDDVPEDGLDQALRVDRIANEVGYRIWIEKGTYTDCQSIRTHGATCTEKLATKRISLQHSE